MDKTSLGDRMKAYERVSDNTLMTKTPVIVRVDGKAFHTLTRGLDKPVDEKFQNCMWTAALKLSEKLQGVKLAYVQSDEISLLITDWETHFTQPCLGNRVQKLASISASIAAVEFCADYTYQFRKPVSAYFDSRVFNVPHHEVSNYFIWRQKDAVRNSIQSLARARFSHNECNNLNCDQLQEKLFQEAGINWNDCSIPQKRGACTRRITYNVGDTVRRCWDVDVNIPTFTQDRDYIEKHLEVPA